MSNQNVKEAVCDEAQVGEGGMGLLGLRRSRSGSAYHLALVPAPMTKTRRARRIGLTP